MNLADIYTRAANVVRTNGHTKGDFYSVPEGTVGITRHRTEYPVCTAGALSVVTCGDPVPEPSGDEYEQVIADFATRIRATPADDRDVTRGIAAWNDAPERTAADVIAAFEQAARDVA